MALVECTVIWTESSLAKLSFRATSEFPIMSGLLIPLCGHLWLQSHQVLETLMLMFNCVRVLLCECVFLHLAFGWQDM